MYDPFNDRKREAPEDMASENRARSLIKYLNTRKDPQDDHAKTVMAFVSQKAAADFRIRNLEVELEQYRMRDMDRNMNLTDERGAPKAPRVLPIPAEARSVEIKF